MMAGILPHDQGKSSPHYLFRTTMSCCRFCHLFPLPYNLFSREITTKQYFGGLAGFILLSTLPIPKIPDVIWKR